MNEKLKKIVSEHLPNKPTQQDFILAYLLTGRVLTRRKSIFLMDIYEAPARIVELQRAGYAIRSAYVKVETQLGRTAIIAIWYLKND